MRIIHLNRDDFGGGAYRSALRLHGALQAEVLDSRMVVGMKRSRDDQVHALSFSEQPADRVRRARRRMCLGAERWWAERHRPDGYEAFDDERSQYGAELVSAVPACDVLNIHFVSGLVDCASFFPSITDRAKVVWTLHDMNPFTGGCHFDDNCARWRERCGACPQLGSRSPNDLSARSWQRKLRCFGAVAPERMCIVAPSQWMAQAARQSPLLRRFRVEVIPYSVDGNVYKPRDRAMCREVLGLDPEARTVLFVAQQIRNRRKGYAALVEALGKLSHVPRLQLLTVGIDVPPLRVSVPVRHLGNMKLEGLLTLAYNAADVFAAPSLQDNLPNTVLESLACGTPIAGFNVGGIPDMVRNGETGQLAAPQDADSLAEAIRTIVVAKGTSRAMRENCRRVAETEFSVQLQGRRYAALYEELAGKRKVISDQ